MSLTVGLTDGRYVVGAMRPRLGERLEAVTWGLDFTARSGFDWPEITVADARGITVLATEVRRRLLPAYERSWAKAQGVIAAREATLATRADAVNRLCAVLAPPYPARTDRRETTVHWNEPNITARLTGDGTLVRLEIVVPLADAAAILQGLVEP